MAKLPRPGKVKTRLVPPLTPKEAAVLNHCFLRDTITSITSILRSDLARGVIVFTPASSKHELEKIIPAEFFLLPQRGRTLGERLVFATEDLFSSGFESVCLIDSDSPTVPAKFFSQAAQILAHDRRSVIIGPSEDGGYYLIGSKAVHRGLYR